LLAASVAASNDASLTVVLKSGEGPLKYLYDSDVRSESAEHV
jgi:hypothetical protein